MQEFQIGASMRSARRGFTVGLACLAFAAGARAADVEVRVVDQNQAKPLAGAAVCLGTTADLGQIGAYLTGADGTVTFRDIPSAPLVLTVSKSRYKGQQRELRPVMSDRIVVVQLPRGGLGPTCPGAVAAAQGAGGTPLALGALVIDGGADTTEDRTVRLEFNARGGPTHYRVSEERDFADARWQPFEPNPTFKLSAGAGRKTIYLQLSRQRQVGGSSLESTSEVVSDTITLR